MTTPDPPDTTTALPIFGRRKTASRRIPFQLCSYDNRERETVHEFTARAGIDASTALQVNSKDAGVQARAIQHLLIRVLVDDDGIGRDERPRRADGGEDDDETGSDLIIPGDAWVIGDDAKEFPSQSLAEQHADEHGSSLRRFARLMDDPMQSVELDALREIVNHLSAKSTGRPTKPSGGSSPRRTPKRARR